MEYCCHVWAGAPSYYLVLLDKLLQWICRTAAPSLAASLEPLAHCQNVASLKETCNSSKIQPLDFEKCTTIYL